jgi:ABC-type polysaccharide/polyol phosphate transport system ATPase subunit
MNETAIRLKNISKTFSVYEKNTDSIRETVFNFFQPNHVRKIEALKSINLEIKKGEFFGIIGRNGSGKSTLLKIIMGAFQPDPGGSVEVSGRMIRLALGMGFDPELSARDNVYLNASLLGLSFKRIGQCFWEIIEFAELDKFVDTKIKYYSSGMYSRLAFSVAVHAQADIFLMDEFFGGVGDSRFMEKSEEVFEKSLVQGRTIVHVGHNLEQIRQHCHRVLLLDNGVPVGIGEPEEMLEKYSQLMQHP